MQVIAARARVAPVRAAASTATTAPPKTLKALNISKPTLLGNGGRAIRNVDSAIYEIIHNAQDDTIKVCTKSATVQTSQGIVESSIINPLPHLRPHAGGVQV
jgi:hypothetical protein